ncbi:Hsp20/alpha crystallin family protein [Siminovitchia sediminis]|uniref:Hsp20/alpha crystallin family protein n=1 Tax=Siminovitchia sediminis TaxID=1274353 RepID=A0ABW4KG47_9BACI
MTENNKDRPMGRSPVPVNPFMKVINDFFENSPVKGLIESLDELAISAPFSGGFPVELKETNSNYIIQAKLPGIKKEQIEIEVLQQFVTITVTHHETITTENNKKETIHRRDTMKKMTRTVPLTKAIDTNNVKAAYENGLLTVSIKKIKGNIVDIT